MNNLKHEKLSELFNSISTISSKQHTALLHVGCWVIFEWYMAYLSTPNFSGGLSGFIKGKINHHFNGSSTDEKALRKSLQANSEFFTVLGNETKHSDDYIPDGKAIERHFNNSEKLLIKLTKEAIEKKEKNS